MSKLKLAAEEAGLNPYLQYNMIWSKQKHDKKKNIKSLVDCGRVISENEE